MELKFTDYSARQVAQLLGVTKQSVEIWCRKRGWAYRLGPNQPSRIPRERIERLLADRDAAARA